MKMDLVFWTMTNGTWVNAAGVLTGTALGVALRARAGAAFQQTVQHVLGLITLVLGVQMALGLAEVRVGALDGVILALLALALGAAVGEGLGLAARVERLGARFKHRDGGRFSEAVVLPFLLFCIGPLTLLGSLANGVTGDMRLLLIKATLDGIAAIALACSLGASVGLSVIPLLAVQLGLSLLAGGLGAAIGNPAESPAVQLTSGVGGVLILGLSLQLLELTRVRVVALLPALPIVPLLYLLLDRLLS
jgi:uncharacterized protein